MVEAIKQSSPQVDVRNLDANVIQRRASNPEASVWVGASAGSGKTKVLTDRILRLLLPDQNGQNANEPHKILALTFTKAAASEMTLRISKRLSEWAVMAEKLPEDLKSLLGQDPTSAQIEAARTLFAKVVDTPGGLKIMTIHSFCQSILGRFPLEADLTPNFKALEEAQAAAYLMRARDHVLKKAYEEKGSPLNQAVYNISSAQNQEQFLSLLNNLMGERRQFEKILKENFGIDGLYENLCKNFDISTGQNKNHILNDVCNSENYNDTDLRIAVTAMCESSNKGNQERGMIIQSWLDSNPESRLQNFKEYKASFLTQKGAILKSLAVKEVVNKNPAVLEILQDEATRIFTAFETIKKAEIAELTRDLFLIGENILSRYNVLKNTENAVDFDDLILKTLNLLQGQSNTMKGLDVSPWVRYKLDQGIDHILVDEAQDTNPEQWEIIKALCDDFFENEEDENRTIFVVGDEKQSIFSFQRASPEKFKKMREWFEEKISSSNKKYDLINFIISFRSVPSILQLTDQIFDDDKIRQGLGDDVITHKSFRHTQAGLIELWPLFETEERQDIDPWTPPTQVIESSTGASKMADHIGATIEGWIKNKEILESHDRPIEAGDILILVRSRNAFIDQLVRALKTRDIAVSGVDRMILSQQLVVQDLTAAANFALLPDDDLNLAGLLKSPFIGWNEEQLLETAYNREGSLWRSVKDSDDIKAISWLQSLIEKSGRDAPYDFFSYLLQNPCPADDISGLRAIKKRLGEECLDPLDEFLNVTLNFEKNNEADLQNFIQSQLFNESQIKREMEEAGKAVRIMTVHGAKGLQAPIVIFPDTVRSNTSSHADRILWPDRTDQRLPYFCPTKDMAPDQCLKALNILKEQNNEEYRRLLYVALTRAENRLYIGGYKGRTKNITDESWYNYICTGFGKFDSIEEIEDENGNIIKRYRNFETDKPDRAHNQNKENNNLDLNKVDAPEWLFNPIPQEPFPPRPLVPSKPSGNEPANLSLLKAGHQKRFLRGNVTHKLLQILPSLSPDQYERASKKYVALPIHDFDTHTQASIVEETLKILNDPVFAPVFGKGSMAEVPITGLLDNKTLISGQIDRLIIRDNDILIVDYKTNRPPPTHEEDVPAIYHKQMKAYVDIMRNLYPEHDITAALLWTDGARLMPLNNL